MNSTFLLAGGSRHARRGADPLLQSTFAATGKKAPSIAYVGAASDDNREFFNWLTASLRQSGSGPVVLAPLASQSSDLDEARRVLSTSDAVFMSGGDVEAGMRILQARGLLPFLRHLHARGKPFLGLSAGSIMLARCWVRWSDPNNDASSEIFPCMNLAPVLCDTHAETEEWEELKALLRLSPPSSIGYGIPSGGGLRVESDGAVSALGLPISRFRHTRDRTVSLSPLEPKRQDRHHTP